MTPSSLPEIFQDRLNRILQGVSDEERLSVFKSFASEKTTTFWVNPLKLLNGGEQAMVNTLGISCESIPRIPWAYRVSHEYRDVLTHSKLFSEGHIYLQNLSSMYAPRVLNPQPGEVVLDMAAAPGGKTLLMAALMQNQGILSAVEVVKGRYFKLKANLEQHGVTIAKTYLMDGRAVGRKTPARFDRVLLDAPCSSEARFSVQDPETWGHWSLRKIKETSKKQKGLIVSAYKSLKSGGSMLYCTCSFAPEENELVIQHLLNIVGEDAVQIEAIDAEGLTVMPGLSEWGKKGFHPDMKKACRVLPDQEVDGFFMCKLKKCSVT